MVIPVRLIPGSFHLKWQPSTLDSPLLLLFSVVLLPSHILYILLIMLIVIFLLWNVSSKSVGMFVCFVLWFQAPRTAHGIEQSPNKCLWLKVKSLLGDDSCLGCLRRRDYHHSLKLIWRSQGGNSTTFRKIKQNKAKTELEVKKPLDFIFLF